MKIMKKIFNIAFAAAAMSALAVSCQTENLEPQTPQEEAGKTITINASLSDVTKAAFSDAEGLKWEEGDVVYASGYKSDGTAVQRGDTKAILSDSYNASFAYTTFEAGDKVWIMYNQHLVGPDKVEFNNFYANVTQENPGEINKELVQLISDPIEISATETSYTAQMKIVGTLMRFLVYSGNGTYAGEQVKSVQLVSSDEPIAGQGNNGTLGYDLDAGKYHVDNAGALGDACKLFWGNDSKTITTTLTSPLSLTGVTEAKQETGIYMAVPPVTVSGYKYVVTTDKAVYTFDASSTSCTFKENTVKNVPLNLESTKAKRVSNDEVKGELQYVSELKSSYNADGEGGIMQLSWCYAVVKENGVDEWNLAAANAIPNSGTNVIFYENVKFSIIDDATSQKADWIDVYYRDADTWWDADIKQNNSGAERSATITATFDDVNGYLLVDGFETKSIKIIQSVYDGKITISLWNSMTEYNYIPVAGLSGHELTYFPVNVGTSPLNNFNLELTQQVYGGAEFAYYDYDNYHNGDKTKTVSWLNCDYKKKENSDEYGDTWWILNADYNNTGLVRKAVIVCTLPELVGYKYKDGNNTFVVSVTQAAE